jgi:hypothetical protein
MNSLLLAAAFAVVVRSLAANRLDRASSSTPQGREADKLLAKWNAGMTKPDAR